MANLPFFEMKTTSALLFHLFMSSLSTACLTACAQSRLSDTALPTTTGKGLFFESFDFRRHLFDERTLEDRVNRGVVCLLKPDFLVERNPQEHSTNSWPTVEAAIRALKLVDRVSGKPQIRVVQKDAILQSKIDFSRSPASGFEPWFLQRELKAGDVIIVTMRRE